MDELKGLATDKWYRALPALSVALIVGALALGDDPDLRKALTVGGVGGVLVGVGQWIDHPYRTRLIPGGKIHGYPYQPSIIGTCITVAGLVFFVRAAVLLW